MDYRTGAYYTDLANHLYDEGTEPLIHRTSKRVFDLVSAAVGILATSPITIAAAAAMKMEGLFDADTRGPVFYAEQRIGQGGRLFNIYKIRTMKPGSKEREREVVGDDYENRYDLRISKDPRVTRVGKFLRKHRIDELLQLCNVLNGDMSMVGPRPYERRAAKFLLERGNCSRYKCPAGLTGPYQITERNSVSDEESIRMDNEYAKSYETGYSVMQDLKLTLKTIPFALRGHSYK